MLKLSQTPPYSNLTSVGNETGKKGQKWWLRGEDQRNGGGVHVLLPVAIVARGSDTAARGSGGGCDPDGKDQRDCAMERAVVAVTRAEVGVGSVVKEN